MSEKAKLKHWEREHGLTPLHIGKLCRECRNFHKPENYCDKWMKKVYPNKYACRYLGLTPLKKSPKVKYAVTVISYQRNEASKASEEIREKIKKMTKNKYKISFYFPKKSKLRKTWVYKIIFIIHNPNEKLLYKLSEIIDNVKDKYKNLEIKHEATYI